MLTEEDKEELRRIVREAVADALDLYIMKEEDRISINIGYKALAEQWVGKKQVVKKGKR